MAARKKQACETCDRAVPRVTHARRFVRERVYTFRFALCVANDMRHAPHAEPNDHLVTEKAAKPIHHFPLPIYHLSGVLSLQRKRVPMNTLYLEILVEL